MVFVSVLKTSINLYFFVAFMGQQKSVLTRYLGTLFGFQNCEFYQTLYCRVTYFVALWLKVKHQLLLNRSFNDQTFMKILDFQRHIVSIKNSFIHQRKLLLYFLSNQDELFCKLLKVSCNVFHYYSFLSLPEKVYSPYKSIQQLRLHTKTHSLNENTHPWAFSHQKVISINSKFNSLYIKERDIYHSL